jgi:HPt (histidine-containing phosphotransfer) domain-containing protein
VNNQTEHKSFIFNEKIDKDLLASLYEDDFPYMEEIFSITLAQLKPDIIQLKAAFEQANVDALKKAAHKLKPSFGFIGLPQVQEQCKQFEDACASATTVDAIASSYKQLVKELEESVIIIESEHKRLQDYNLSQL